MGYPDLYLALFDVPGPTRYVAAAATALLVGLLGEGLLQALIFLVSAVARRTRTTYDDHLVQRLRGPLRLLVAVLAVHVGAALLDFSTLVEALVVGEWLLSTFIVVESAETLLVDLVLKERFQVKVPPLLRQLTIGVVYAGAVLTVLGRVFGVDVTPLLATTSVVSLVLGLALQQPLSNLFAGLVLHFERAVSEGDWITVNGRDGQVTHLGWRTTRLHTLSDDVLILPNNVLLSAEVQNYSQPTRITSRLLELPVSYAVSPEQLLGWVVEDLANIPRILSEPPPKVRLLAFESSAQRYQLKFWVEDFRFHDDLESDVLKALWRRFAKEGVPLAQEAWVKVRGE